MKRVAIKRLAKAKLVVVSLFQWKEFMVYDTI